MEKSMQKWNVNILLVCKQLYCFINSGIQLLWSTGSENRMLQTYILKVGKNLKIFYLYMLTSYNLFNGLNNEQVRIHFSFIKLIS